MDKDGKGTGKLTKNGEDGIRTGPDKLREMKKVMDKKGYTDDILTIYVGDSNTDLPCLLFADIGIVIGRAGSLVETCKTVGVEVVTGASLRDVVRSSKEKGRRRLYNFKDWNEILESGLLD